MSGLDVSLVPRSIACSLHYLPTFAFSTIYQLVHAMMMMSRHHQTYALFTRTLAELDARFYLDFFAESIRDFQDICNRSH